MSPGRFSADYFDGRSSVRHAVEVAVEGGMVRVRGAGVAADVRTDELRIHPPVGSLPVRIDLPGGALLVARREALAGVIEVPRQAGLAQKLESHLGVVLASMAGLLVAGWFAYRDGIPWAAREAAMRLPPEIEKQLSVEGLEAMDRAALRPTQLPAERRERVREMFAQLAQADPGEAVLHFRDGGWIGANAFALPGGAVVVTDQLVTLLDDDELVTAVLAHEIGHLRHRHGARQILQASMTALASAMVLGDVSSVASLAATVPTVLMHTSYTRDFEREADRFAYGLLAKTGRSPRLLGQALAALEAARGSASLSCPAPADEASSPGEKPAPAPRRAARDLGYLSTHPATRDRIDAAEAAAR